MLKLLSFWEVNKNHLIDDRGIIILFKREFKGEHIQMPDCKKVCMCSTK